MRSNSIYKTKLPFIPLIIKCYFKKMVRKCDFWDISCCSKNFFELPIQRNERRKFNFEIGSAQPCMQNEVGTFSNFSWRFSNPNFNFNCSKVLDLKNLQEQAQKAFCFNLYCWNKCPIDLIFANSHPSPWISNVFLNHCTRSIFLMVGQNNFGNKIPFYG